MINYKMDEPLLSDEIIESYREDHAFFVIETDKRVYYPGEIIECAVHLRTYITIERA